MAPPHREGNQELNLVHREAEQDESVIDRLVAAQREDLEAQIGTLHAEAEQIAGEARELAGEVPF